MPPPHCHNFILHPQLLSPFPCSLQACPGSGGVKSVCWRTEPGDILGSFHRGKVFVVRFSTCFPANLTDCPFKSIRDDVGSKTAGCAYVGSAEASFQTRPLCSVVRTDVNFYEHWLI